METGCRHAHRSDYRGRNLPIMAPRFQLKSNVKSMECELHCPVCKEIVKQPVVLPCQHSVCLMCASEVLDLGRIRRRGDGVRNHPLRCCFHARPVGGRYRHTVSLGSVAVMCQFCKPPLSLEATKGCADCQASFCNECFKLYHPWGTPRAQHEHVQPTLNFRPKVLSCPEHDQERLHFYCRTCQRLLCPLCKLRRVHAGHKVAPVAQAYQTLKDKITKEMNYILSNQETVLGQISQLESEQCSGTGAAVSERERPEPPTSLSATPHWPRPWKGHGRDGARHWRARWRRGGAC
ncbi:unnamed protein product [Coregonus sp. 'balchen']|nr:unnamed protein product [Coregonus sp. 'balchen']